MRLYSKWFATFLLLLPLGLTCNDSELQEFDDDAFLAAQVEPTESRELVGWSLFRSEGEDDKYVINFNNVSIIEYLRFVGKISNVNFQFEEADLNFAITVMSEDPLTVPSIVSALIQTLRARGFSLLEEDNNLLITRSTTVNQIPTIVGPEKKKGALESPIVTRIFRIENANLSSLAGILRPMISKGAMIEISNETRQLIVTDITTNVDKIATLLRSLDTPHSPLDIETYQARYMPAETLAITTKRLIEPFAEENPLIFVSQNETNTVFIVSTPHLIERAMSLMEDLDAKPKGTKTPVGDQVFLYPIKNKAPHELLKALQDVASAMKSAGSQSTQLIGALENAKWIKDSNSILFITDGATQKKIEELLPNFDSTAAGSTTSQYWLYTPKYLSGKELEDAIDDLRRSLFSSGLSDQDLINSIDSVKWVSSTNTLLFTGPPASLKHIQSMIKLIDIPSGSPSKIFLYKPSYISNEQIEEALDELADKLDHKNLSDRNLAAAIDNMTWIADSQNFLFKADPSTIEKIAAFLKDIDSPKEAEAIANAFFLYKLKFARGEDVIDHLEKIGQSLPDRDLAQKALIAVIDSTTLLADTNALLLTGTQKAVEEVKIFIEQFDVPDATTTAYVKSSFFIYKPVHLTPQELEEAIRETAADLKSSGLLDANLLQSLETMRTVEATDSVIFTGTKDSLEKTKEIIANVDVAGTSKKIISEFAGRNFFIYKVRYISVKELLKLLNNVVKNLEKEGDTGATVQSIKGAKEVKESNSILFTGTPEVLKRISELLAQLDIPKHGKEQSAKEPMIDATSKGPGSYLIYKPVNVGGPQLIDMMNDFAQNLESSGVSEPNLYETIDTLKYIQKTGFILISGDEQSVEKTHELLRKFDISGLAPEAAAKKEAATVTALPKLKTSFLIYKLQYHQGAELQKTLKTIGQDLSSADPQSGSQLLAAINSIQWIKMTNSLLATGSPDVLTQLKELIESIDVPLRQVFIEVLIIQTTMTNNQQFGLQWGSKVQYLNRFAGGVSNFPTPSSDTGTASRALQQPLIDVNETRTPLSTDILNPSTNGGGLDLGIIGDIILHKGRTFLSLASLVNALQSDIDSVIVMNPKIIAQDNQQSTIFVGQNIPFTGSVVTTQGASQQTSANIEYRDVGVSLSITPILGTNEVVTMDITNEITSQVENTTTGTDNLQGLQTSRTSLNARVHVPNKHFVALSGMIQDRKEHFKSGIPCLGGLPVVGALFSDNQRLNNRDNVIFFIRPIIIDSVAEYDKITENQERLYKDVGSKQIVKEEIDEAIDWVRDPYCE